MAIPFSELLSLIDRLIEHDILAKESISDWHIDFHNTFGSRLM